ncbi:mitochondrial inner membrane protein [Pisolithus marmoratus]|nr:mitochondrial inner membrane protein [Pisolithus marmoratus]
MSASILMRAPLSKTFASTAGCRSSYPEQSLSVRHTASSAMQYVPGGPIYKGTVNDPTTFPPPSKMHGSHHWSFERLLAAYPVLDGIFGVSLVMHSHIGFDSMLVDYLHPRKFPFLGNFAKWTLRTMTLGVLVGVYQFNTNDIGV